MSDRRTRMLEDKYLRESARALVEADIEHLKSDFSHKSLGERAFDRVREGAADLYEEAIDVADDNRGALAALVAWRWGDELPLARAQGRLMRVEETRDEDARENAVRAVT